jgi:hypothetical protein
MSSHVRSSDRQNRPVFPRWRVVLHLLGVAMACVSVFGRPMACAEAQIRQPPQNAAAPVFPLKVSSNRRYLVDSNNAPFLIIGDAPQTLINKVSLADAASYMGNRRQYGINSLWINLLCNPAEGCRDDATTLDGIAPFITPNDLTTPNPAYFQHAERVMSIAASMGMVVLLDPIETSGWLTVLRANGVAKAFAYGQFLGSRFASTSNLIWLHGNDFQTWRERADDDLVQAVARGIRSKDAVHLHTIELDFPTSGSLDDTSWAPLVDLDAAYTYLPTYVRILTEYNRPNFKPVFLIEASYEFEHLERTDGGSTGNLRRQGYWSILCGAAGQVYGSGVTWRLEPGWQAKLDSPGATELMYMKRLFADRRWYDLVPDQAHSILTSGYGSLSFRIGEIAAYAGASRSRVRSAFHLLKRNTGFGSIDSNRYAPAAVTADGSLMIAYLPSIRTVTIDMSKLASPTRASWYDPTNGNYVTVDGSPITDRSQRQFTPPGSNSAGAGDWVLLLEQAAVP